MNVFNLIVIVKDLQLLIRLFERLFKKKLEYLIS